MTGFTALDRSDLVREAAYIDGVWKQADATVAVSNPANGALLGTVPDMGTRATQDAVAAAYKALPAWQAKPPRERGAILRRWSELVRDNQEDLARILTQEQGKPLAEARGEIGSSAAYLEWFSEEARRAYGSIIPANQTDKRMLVTRQPVGVVAAITPWNFPSSMIPRKAGPALAVGCTMVLKPSELTPYSALALAALAEEAGIPAGVFNVVTGAPEPIGDVLVEDDRIAKFTFTGSTAVGKALAARCMGTAKRVSLELGGNAPFIVFADADIDAAVEGALLSKFRNAGQTCICTNRFLVEDAIYNDFTLRLAEKARALLPGNGLEQGVTQGPLINAAARQKVERHLEDAMARGARLLSGGPPDDSSGTFFPATVLADVDRASLLCREETFGPLAAIIRFDGEDDAIALANHNRAGLAAYAYTRDLARAHRMSEKLAYGMVGINTGLVSSEVSPFGGIKESGFGREGGREGLNDYLSTKLTVLDIPAS
ncbi:NAD-dependent succinate-semialdehyde dehydrogenase [Altericroceibacterium spongiae]|uniref:NAD-dependent succinate-semialdehyde dehydrogenase n=1 Tax=Altericroceibacterium spongiae TaxID=2320269 RepID=A0A420EFC0_9SPHN|nr:NAD-dependent succinate-semialdehyde dehydrogenase [Altericroceibacterium spongiae]RKF19382.1 NAD-dependent succinate-semialdehyde dehydrogenase [Altericroceibacterium spongiae]